MDTIKVKWEVNTTSGIENISLAELECDNMDEWNALDELEQESRLQEALDNLPERTSIIVEDWS